MLSLVVRCERVENGCEWEGEIRALDEHKSTCLHMLVPCPRGCDVGSVLRGDLQSHLQDSCSQRDYKCPHCHEIGRYSERVTSHLQDCAMVPAECPNEGCEEKIVASLMQAHVDNDCLFTVHQCKYSEAGCKVQLPCKALEAHENNDRYHLQLVMKNSQETIAALQSDMDKLTVALKYSQDKFAALQGEVDKQTRCSQDTIAALRNDMDKLRKANTSLRSEINGLQTTQAQLHKTLTLKDKTIFKVTRFQQKKRVDAVFNSPYFYSSPKGYHMYIMVYANGDDDGKGTHISVYAMVEKGDFDYKLKWPFVGDVTLTLLNQLEDKNHCEDTINVTSGCNVRAGQGRGYHKFILHSSLGFNGVKNTQYLKDNTLYFMVSVSVCKRQPWLDCTV